MPNDDQHERDLRAIAHLVHQVRADWDIPGIMAALRESPGGLADLVIAAVTAARDRRDQRTPAVIAMDGPHWRNSAPISPAEPAQHTGPPCWGCGLPESMHAEMARRLPGYCAGFQHRRPKVQPGARPASTRNLRKA